MESDLPRMEKEANHNIRKNEKRKKREHQDRVAAAIVRPADNHRNAQLIGGGGPGDDILGQNNLDLIGGVAGGPREERRGI